MGSNSKWSRAVKLMEELQPVSIEQAQAHLKSNKIPFKRRTVIELLSKNKISTNKNRVELYRQTLLRNPFARIDDVLTLLKQRGVPVTKKGLSVHRDNLVHEKLLPPLNAWKAQRLLPVRLDSREAAVLRAIHSRGEKTDVQILRDLKRKGFGISKNTLTEYKKKYRYAQATTQENFNTWTPTKPRKLRGMTLNLLHPRFSSAGSDAMLGVFSTRAREHLASFVNEHGEAALREAVRRYTYFYVHGARAKPKIPIPKGAVLHPLVREELGRELHLQPKPRIDAAIGQFLKKFK